VNSSRSNIASAAYLEAVGRFYAGAVSGAFGSFSRTTLPVGLMADGKVANDTPMLTGPLEKKNPDGTPTYAHGIHKLVDTAESPALIRNAYTAQHDQNAMTVLAGPPASLLKVLELPGSKDLIAAKCRYLVCVFPEAAKALESAGWPTPIFSISPSLSTGIMFPASSIESDFSWSPAHPVADGYRAAKPMPYDSPTGDIAAVFYAVRPTDKAFALSEPVGKIRQVMLEPAEKDRLLKSYIELASAKPVPRVPRFRRPVEAQKPDPAKPAPPKAQETKPQDPAKP
jgi:hypothetical protein